MQVPVIYRHVFSAPPQTNLAHDIHFRAPGILTRAGVELSIGLRLGAWSAANQRNLPYHAAHAIPLGLKRKDALAAITIHPAKLMGVHKSAWHIAKRKRCYLHRMLRRYI